MKRQFFTIGALLVSGLWIAGCSENEYHSTTSTKVIQTSQGDSIKEFVYQQDSSAYEELDVVSIKEKKLSGVSQKGPFVAGSVIKLYELDGRRISQTGKSFIGKISGEKGKYSVTALDLVSQYVIVEAQGYYQNEVSGYKSNSPLTLLSLVDIQDRSKANINLLTHLEYSRVLNLVSQGINVPMAKKQAAAELFHTFGFEEEYDDPEDLSIAQDDDGSAALLAISVLLQGNKSEADLSELLEKISEDVTEDGSWDDNQAKTNIADWALSANLSDIRKNVESWDLGTIPEFELYIYMFCNKVLGMGTCTKERQDEIWTITNKYSKNKNERLVCDEKQWRRATTNDLIKSSSSNRDEEATESSASDIKYGSIKDSRDNQTYKTVKIGTQIWMAENLNYDPGKNKDSWCASNDCGTYGRLYSWETANNNDICPDGWHVPTNDEWETLYNYVEKNNGNESIETSLKSTTMWATPGSNKFGFSALPAGYYWGDYSDQGTDAAWWSSSEDSYDQGIDWRLYNGANYDDLGMPKEVGFAIRCISGEKLNQTIEESSSSSKPSSSETIIIKNGFIVDSRDKQEYKTVKIGNQVWMAQNLNYEGADGACYNDLESNCKKYGKLYSWAGAMNIDLKYNNSTWDGSDKNVQGICPAGTHLPSKAEWNTLVDYIGYENSGLLLRSTTGWDGTYNSGNGTDAYGFNALSAGTYAWDYVYIGQDGYWWASTETGSNTAINRDMDMCPNCLYEDSDSKDYKFSVRCIIDDASSLPDVDVPIESSSTSATPYSENYDCKEYNCVTTEYLNQDMFAAGKYGELLDTRDNQVYRTIKIGEQTWMAQNLNYVSNGGNADDGEGSFCYDDKQSNCDIYGRIYSWTASVNKPSGYSTYDFVDQGLNLHTYQGICPEEYHIPTLSDITQLIEYVEDVSGQYYPEVLAAQSKWSFRNSADPFGYSALPGGWIFDYGGHVGIEENQRNWLALDNERTGAYNWGLYGSEDPHGRSLFSGNLYDDNINYQYYKFYIRCVKD